MQARPTLSTQQEMIYCCRWRQSSQLFSSISVDSCMDLLLHSTMFPMSSHLHSLTCVLIARVIVAIVSVNNASLKQRQDKPKVLDHGSPTIACLLSGLIHQYPIYSLLLSTIYVLWTAAIAAEMVYIQQPLTSEKATQTAAYSQYALISLLCIFQIH